jgi:two-component system, OmpR family, osmolarity sensor histidine kinase EnvZ
MASWLNSLAVRIGLIFALGLLALQVAFAAVILWPDGRPMVFRLVSPEEAAAMARALETVSDAQRPAVVEALNAGSQIVHIIPDFPDEPVAEGGGGSPRIERAFARYAEALEGRPYRVQARAGHGLAGPIGSPGALRLLVGLGTGEVLVVERAPVLLQRIRARLFVLGLIATLILGGVMLACLLQVARPARRLALASRDLARDMETPDLPVRGAREMRALARAFNQMKGDIRSLMAERTRVLAAIAHDLRTYLTRLRLRTGFIADDQQRAKAEADLDEMGRLLDDTLLFARSSVAPGASSASADVAQELAALVAVRQEMGEPVTAPPAPGTDAPLTAAAPSLVLRRILSNLVDNAVRYGGAAELAAWRDDDRIRIAVRDRGPGAPPEALDRMLEPFERLEPSRGRATGGAGLGLSIARALAQAQGGDLTVSNRGGGGLEVVVTLPATDA